MLADLTVKEFLKKTESGFPVPGGGSVAALCAALAASLTAMVANLTLGKTGYEAAKEDIQTLLQDVMRLREKLVVAIDNDSNAYGEVISAMQLPKGTETEKQHRERMIQGGLKQASVIPMNVAKDAAKVMRLAGEAVEKGNRNTISDGTVGIIMAKAAVLSALCSVRINLPFIKDKTFVDKISREVKELEKKTREGEKEFWVPGDF